ncbi:PREDICTED: zinc finger protein GIS-like [Tarenaya hassleriana]|uniref:zinc finger protein GIS-like n=1 Tax=Tarenaya hassleriana TaxID=28532 RepID=UPI00053C5B86|nr:PREDICTED: zinc finger protein GIS-like [Tarenaya hassleriana]
MESQVVSISSSSDSSSTKLVVAEKDSTKPNKVEPGAMNPKPGFQILSRDRIQNHHLGWGEDHRHHHQEGGSSSRSRVYTCNFCKKEFSTSQALGGHQNAHKQEREWEKKRKQIELEYPSLAFLHPYLNRSPFSSGSWINSLSYDNHLGSRFDAFFQKPSFYTPANNTVGYSSGYGTLAMVPRVPPAADNNRVFAGKDLVLNDDDFSKNLFPSNGFPKDLHSNDVLPKDFALRSNVGSSKSLFIGDGRSRNLISIFGGNSSTTDKDLADKEDVQQKNVCAKEWGQDLSL